LSGAANGLRRHGIRGARSTEKITIVAKAGAERSRRNSCDYRGGFQVGIRAPV